MYFFLSPAAKDLMSKADKAGKFYQRAFQDYTSRVFTILEASKNN
jgi:hypothetical protein